MKKALLIAGGAILLLTLVGISMCRGRDGGTRVHVETVERREIARIVKASGIIDARTKVVISPRVTGEIQRLAVVEGQELASGELFAQLDQELFQAAVDRAAAVVESAQAQASQTQLRLEQARLALTRGERLWGEELLAPEQFEQIQLDARSAALDVEQARQAVAQARADLDRAQEDLRRTTVRAPMAGTVTELVAKEGEVVIAGTTNLPGSRIGTLSDLSEILAEVEVDESDVVHVAVGQQAVIQVDAVEDRDYEARVVEVGSSGFHPDRQPDLTYFRVKLLLAEPDTRLRPGMSARASIRSARQQDALVVPIQAVVRRPPLDSKDAGDREEDLEDVVFAFEDGRARQQPVEVGLTDETHAQIVEGLAEGTSVVTGPYRDLRDLEDGDPVQAREEEAVEDGAD